MRIIFFIKTLRLIYYIYSNPLILLALRGLKKGLKVIFDFKTLRLFNQKATVLAQKDYHHLPLQILHPLEVSA